MVVCDVDDSLHAAAVMGVALGLARRLDLRLRVVHSVPCHALATQPEREIALQRAGQLLDALIPYDDGSIDRVLEVGDPLDPLPSAVGDGADLLVVGARGRWRAIVAAASCPVVVVPPDATSSIPRDPAVVCGIEVSPAGDAALARTARLARALGARFVPARGHEPAQLVSAAIREHAALLAVGGAGRGSLTTRLVADSPIPVVICR